MASSSRMTASLSLLPQFVGYRVRAQQVDDAGEAVLPPDRQLHDQRRRVQATPDRLDGGVEVGARAVQLVDERDPRHAVPIRLAPHGFALRLDARDGVEHGDGAVEHPQRALDLVGEVDVAGRVDEGEAVAGPRAAHGRGEDGDAAVAFLRVEVGDGGAVVDLARPVDDAGTVQDPFGDGGLAGVDVGEDAEVADVVEVRGAHGAVLVRKIRFRAARFRVTVHKGLSRVRCQPRGRHRGPEDTRITSKRERETAMRGRMAGSSRSARVCGSGAA